MRQGDSTGVSQMSRQVAPNSAQDSNFGDGNSDTGQWMHMNCVELMVTRFIFFLQERESELERGKAGRAMKGRKSDADARVRGQTETGGRVQEAIPRKRRGQGNGSSTCRTGRDKKRGRGQAPPPKCLLGPSFRMLAHLFQ